MRAKIRAAAIGSAIQLNSPTGVMFPGMESAPDMAISSKAFVNVVADSEAAREKFVRGPMDIRVIVSGGWKPRMRRISR